RVLLARALDERAELRVEGLRVEAVRVPAGDGGHPWPEATHDDRRRRLGTQEARRARPQPPDERDRVDHALRADRVGVDRLADGRLFDGVRSAAVAASTQPEEQSPARDRLKG